MNRHFFVVMHIVFLVLRHGWLANAAWVVPPLTTTTTTTASTRRYGDHRAILTTRREEWRSLQQSELQPMTGERSGILHVAAAVALQASNRDDDDIDDNEMLPPLQSSKRSGPSFGGGGGLHMDLEWHPHDPAYTTPQLLVGLWDQIAGAKTMTYGETMTVIYPQMQEQFTPRYLTLLMGHLDVCKDVCDHFGSTTTLMPYVDAKTKRVTGFTVKSFRKPKVVTSKGSDGDGSGGTSNDSNNEDDDNPYQFGYDPFWPDDEEMAYIEQLYARADDEDDTERGEGDGHGNMDQTSKSSQQLRPNYPDIVDKIPSDDDVIMNITRSWVGTMMSNMGVCPFSAGPDRAGLPIGNVFYCVDRSSCFEDVYARYWKEVVRVEQHSEKDISTTLLILPEFCLDNVELFETFTNTLTQPLTAMNVEDLLQLVFFHPHWSFRDGEARSSPQGQAANYARRSPWPMINLLRTKQVRAAQKGIPTGLVYKQNEKTLSAVGVDRLERMLRLRDWDDLADFKVNRREFDALKIAHDYQITGKVDPKDMSLEYDATPAANKANRNQVEKGDLVNVVMQALEKRLGKFNNINNNSNNGVFAALTGPETSATIMASEFLVGELDRIVALAGRSSVESQQERNVAEANVSMTASLTSPTATTATAMQSPPQSSSQQQQQQQTAMQLNQREPDEIVQLKRARVEESRRALLADLSGVAEAETAATRRRDLSDVAFGKAGISELASEDELFQEGLNPDSFY